MLKFTTNGKTGSFDFIFPTKLEELTPDYLILVAKDVEVANDYTLIGVCYREKLSTIIVSSKQNKNLTTAVVPIFIKSGISENGFVKDKCETGNKIIISPSQIALGHHVVCPENKITISNFLAYLDGDKDAYRNALNINSYVYFLEFKIVPNCDIIGIYKDSKEKVPFNNPFTIVPVATVK